MKAKNGYVYFVSNGNGYIKIGVTESVGRRLKQLQTGNAVALKLVHVATTKNMDEAHKIETALHKRFKRYRAQGEWFKEKPVMRLLRHNRIHVGGYTIKGIGYPMWKIAAAVAIGVAISIALTTFG